MFMRIIAFFVIRYAGMTTWYIFGFIDLFCLLWMLFNFNLRVQYCRGTPYTYRIERAVRFYWLVEWCLPDIQLSATVPASDPWWKWQGCSFTSSRICPAGSARAADAISFSRASFIAVARYRRICNSGQSMKGLILRSPDGKLASWVSSSSLSLHHAALTTDLSCTQNS